MEKNRNGWVCSIDFPLDLFILACISIVMFLTVELISRIYDFYLIHPNIDVVTHLFAGVAFFYTFYFIATILHDRYKRRISFTFTFIGAVIWEIVETLGELLIVDPPHLRDIFFWDGFFDILFTLVGAGVALIYLEHSRGYLKKQVLLRFFN